MWPVQYSADIAAGIAYYRIPVAARGDMRERPTQYVCIKRLGDGKIVGRQIEPDEFPGKPLPAGRVVDRRQRQRICLSGQRAGKHAERQLCNHAAQATERRCHLILKLAISLPRVDETAVLASLSKLLFIHRLLGSHCRESSLASMRFHDNGAGNARPW